MNQRIALARVDNTHRQNSVATARRIIYDQQYQVNSAAVERLLRDESLTPNVVRFILINTIKTALIVSEFCRTPSQSAWGQWALMFLRYCCLTRCTKLHLVYGGLCSSTFYEYSSQKTISSFWNWISGKRIHVLASMKILIMTRRYRAIPSFGRDTIRRFAENCSEMKRMAAHNFEDLLQVSEQAVVVPTQL